MPNQDTGDVPKTEGFRCTGDGLVYVTSVAGETCAVEPTLSSFYQRKGYEVHELVATDTRAPWRSCSYDVDYTRTERPFACNGMGGPME